MGNKITENDVIKVYKTLENHEIKQDYNKKYSFNSLKKSEHISWKPLTI